MRGPARAAAPRQGSRCEPGPRCPSRSSWSLVSAGLGEADLDTCFRVLNEIGYPGPVSVEWEDPGMDRLDGAPLALACTRAHLYDPPQAAFDSHFSRR